MHTINPDAHGLAALAVIEALVLKLIGNGTLDKAGALEICAAIKTTFDARGVRHDSTAESDAGLLVAGLIRAIQSKA